MVKKEEILELLNAYKSEVDNFNDAIFTDKFEALAQDIVKLFAIPVVVKSLPEWQIYQKAHELDEKEFEQWMYDNQ